MEGFITNAEVQAGQRAPITAGSGGRLESPKHIIQTVGNARSLYSVVREQNLKRIALWAAIEGLLGGNPPYEQEDLDKHGLSFLTNYNDLSARAKFRKKRLSYFNLLHQAEVLVKFELKLDDARSAEWAQKMSIAFDKELRRWKGWSSMMGTHMNQLTKFGLSPLLWHDERDWRPRTIQLNRFLLPDEASTDPELLTFCFLESDFSAQYLWSAYDQVADQEDDSYDKFWNKKALGQLLLTRANTMMKPRDQQFVDMFQLQQALQNADIGYQIYGDQIRLITLLYKEYSGKITHYMFDSNSGVDNFVFMASEQYEEFSQAVSIFTSSPGEFTFHGNRGIGHEVFSPCQAKNQLTCSLVDMARYSSTPMLRNNAGAVRDPQQIKMFPGVPTDIGGAEFVQNNLGNNLPQVVSTLQYMKADLAENLAIAGDDPAVPDQSTGSLSPTDAVRQSFREFNILKDEVAHFYDQLDGMYRNMVAIGLRSKSTYPGYESIKRWKEECLRQGVPEEAFDVKPDTVGLPDQLDVTASRVAGDGSTVGLMLGLNQLGATVGGALPPKGQKAFLRDSVLAALGPDAIDRYLEGLGEADEVSAGASLAGVENGLMQVGMSPIFSPTNEHYAHVAVHMALNANIMQQIQQQQLDPISANKILELSVPHTKEHLQFLSQSPLAKQFLEKWMPAFEQIEKYYILNRKNAIKMYQAKIREQQELEAQQAEMLSKEGIAREKMEREEDRKDWETHNKAKRQDKESETRANLKEKEIRQKADTDRLKAQLDAGVKQVKVEAEAGLEANRQALEDLTEVDLPTEETDLI